MFICHDLYTASKLGVVFRPTLPGFRRARQEDLDFNASPSYETHYVAKADLGLQICLPPSLKCWGYPCKLLDLAGNQIVIKKNFLLLISDVATLKSVANLIYSPALRVNHFLLCSLLRLSF